jgi:MFS family permease
MSAAGICTVGVIMQCGASGLLSVLYIGRFISGIGVGAASMLTPLYISENAPRAIRGGLTGLYQLFIASGTMLSFWVNYGAFQNLANKGDIVFELPLALQMIPAVLLFIGMVFCYESPRWLARNDKWERAQDVLSITRHLPREHDYIAMEMEEMREQLENERRIIGGATFMDLQREMWLIPGNRKRALISIGLMVCQQMTGTVCFFSFFTSYPGYPERV